MPFAAGGENLNPVFVITAAFTIRMFSLIESMVIVNHAIFVIGDFLLKSMDFEQLKARLVQLAASNDNIELLWLYGSYAKGSAHDNSDIDLAVAFKTWEKDVIERRLRPELLALDWQNTLNLPEAKLSIVDINLAPIPLAMSVLKTGELWLCKNGYRQAQELQRIMSKWEIDYLYHYQHQQAMSIGNG